MASKPIIRVIGSLNIDFVTCTPRVPSAGETISATSMTVHAGGKGANQAVGCGKAAFVAPGEQDVVVEMIGAVGAGDPYYASLLKPTLEKSGVGTGDVEEIEGVQTGTATIIVDDGNDGENRILFVAGANRRVDDVEKVVATAVNKKEPEVVVMQGEIPRDTVLGLLETFNRSKSATSVVFNPAPVFAEGIPLAALKGLAVLVANETECLLLFKAVPELREEQIDLPTSTDDMTESQLDRLTKHLHDLACISIVVVTLGSRGVYYSAAATSSRGFLPALKVDKVVDTTGAGDTFVGYFATALARHLAGQRHDDNARSRLEGFDVRTAVDRAQRASAKCVQRSGAMESIPFGYE
jgi:ribokinase